MGQKKRIRCDTHTRGTNSRTQSDHDIDDSYINKGT